MRFDEHLKRLVKERQHQKQDEIVRELWNAIRKDAIEIQDKKCFEDIVEKEYHEALSIIIKRVQEEAETTFVVRYGWTGTFPNRIDEVLTAVAKKLGEKGITCTSWKKEDNPFNIRIFHIAI